MGSTTAAGWSQNAQYYEDVIGRMTGPVCKDIVSRVDSISSLKAKGSQAFDNGTGTGLLARELAKRFPGLPITATDVSPGMAEQARKTVEATGMKNVTVQVEDACNLKGLQDGTFTHSLSTAMIGSTPDPQAVVNEMYRVTKPGGVLGLTSWVGHCWPDAWQRAVRRALNKPDYIAPRMVDPVTGSKDAMRDLLQKAGWHVVEVTEEKAPFFWPSREDCMAFFWSKDPNPIAHRMRKDFSEEEQRAIRPEFDKSFDEEWPDATQMYETAVIAVAVKK